MQRLQSRAAGAQRQSPTPDAPGAAAYVDVDRDTAARLSSSRGHIDDALYSAFGQRIVSTIFTETNQYRVILEGRPEPMSQPAGARACCS